ncbi:MAG: pyridoxine 5'-phosphate synthase [Vicingaceae bacterium]
MTRLSVNINKIATLRNARGGDVPNLTKVALDCESFGAQGITVHPRPDERHIRYKDVYDLSKVLTTEFNIEGYPNQKFIDLVLDVKPAQVTLVPDPPGVLTSNAGWNAEKEKQFLKPIIEQFKEAGIRTSIFMETDKDQIKAAKETGTDRIELYTGPFAENFNKNPSEAVSPFAETAAFATKLGLGVNAGHDLDLENLSFFKNRIPSLLEVSIGHALISNALYYGLENTIQLYLRALK